MADGGDKVSKSLSEWETAIQEALGAEKKATRKTQQLFAGYMGALNAENKSARAYGLAGKHKGYARRRLANIEIDHNTALVDLAEELPAQGEVVARDGGR